jgi:hypothetical protein
MRALSTPCPRFQWWIDVDLWIRSETVAQVGDFVGDDLGGTEAAAAPTVEEPP